MKSRLITLTVLAASLLATTALAQDYMNDRQGMVLVTPEGELMDYVPDAADVVVKVNRRGQKVLIDN